MDKKTYSCFLVSPFGNKELGASGRIGNFELIRASLKEVIESYPEAEIRLKRADEIVDVGSVAESFILALNYADIVVADLTQITNANVYYELGIRFALRNRITISIWQKGTELPADVRGLLGVEYEPTKPKQNTDAFHRFIRQRLQATLSDSPVHKILPDISVISAAELERLRKQVDTLKAEVFAATLDGSIQAVWKEHELDLSKSIEAYERGFNVDNRSTYCLLNAIALLLARKQPGDRIKRNRLRGAADTLTSKSVAQSGSDHWSLYDRAHFELFYGNKQ